MAEEVNGIINVYKEAGYTSHDVVAKLRGILHQKRSAIQEHWIRRRRESFRYAVARRPRCVNCLPIKKKLSGSM